MTSSERDELEALERALLTGDVRKNPAALLSMLAEEFREYGASGRTYTRAEIMSELAVESPAVLGLEDFRAEPLGPGVVLVTYRSSRLQQDQPVRHALRSSIWVWRDNRWQMVFHQGTVVPATQVRAADIQS